MDGPGFPARRFGQALGGPAGGRREKDLSSPLAKTSTTALMMVVLPVPGPPVITRTFFPKTLRDSLPLASAKESIPRSRSTSVTAVSRSKGRARRRRRPVVEGLDHLFLGQVERRAGKAPSRRPTGSRTASSWRPGPRGRFRRSRRQPPDPPALAAGPPLSSEKTCPCSLSFSMR